MKKIMIVLAVFCQFGLQNVAAADAKLEGSYRCHKYLVNLTNIPLSATISVLHVNIKSLASEYSFDGLTSKGTYGDAKDGVYYHYGSIGAIQVNTQGDVTLNDGPTKTSCTKL